MPKDIPSDRADPPASDARNAQGFEPIGEVTKRLLQRLKEQSK